MSVVGVLTFASALPVNAQDGITENPDGAAKIERLWYKLGSGASVVGWAAGGVTDLDTDGYDDFIYRASGLDWYLHRGGDTIAETASWRFVSDAARTDVRFPVVGDFLGNDSVLVGLSDGDCSSGNGICYIRIYFFRQSDTALLEPSGHVLRTRMQNCNVDLAAADMDNDGDDELIFASYCYRPEIRIYEGGPDFDLSEPTLRIVDSSKGNIPYQAMDVGIGDFDGDSLYDLAAGIQWFPEEGEKRQVLWFWWGEDGSPWSWGQVPDRTVELGDVRIDPDRSSVGLVEDYDGDGACDLLGFVSTGDNVGTYMWRSGSEQDVRRRSFDKSDCDGYYRDCWWTLGFGTIGDSTNRYDMLAVTRRTGLDRVYGLAGGRNGPNHTYDLYNGGGDGPRIGGYDAGDIDGDGWRDRIVHSSLYGGSGVGFVGVFSGGPYIPNDDPTVSVRRFGSAEREASYAVWPNPAHASLRVAWRGDLRWMPHHAQLYTLRGRRLRTIDLAPWGGTVTIDVSDLPAGVYRLCLLDARGQRIGATQVVRQ